MRIKFLLWLWICDAWAVSGGLTQAFAQQWYPSPVPRGRHINEAAVLQPGAIVVAGGNEFNDSIRSIFTSVNGGLSWNLRADNISSWLKSIDFIDSLNGLAAGYNGRIYRTHDKGHTWSLVPSPIYTRHFNKLIFVDSLTAFIAGGWQKNDSMQTILRSTDGGNSWAVVLDRLGPWLKSIRFRDALNGVAVGEAGVILKTADGGTSWTPVASPLQRDFNALAFINDTVGYIAGGRRSSDSIRTILQTTDGGASWAVLKDELGAWLTDIYFLNDDTGYIAGYQATLLKTTNGGQAWNPVYVTGSRGDEAFSTVRFYDADFGLVGGRFGNVFIYTKSQMPIAQTTGHVVNDSTRVTLQALVSTHGYSGQFWFVYALDSAFTTATGQTYPQDVQSNALEPVVATVPNLQPYTVYYFYVVARTFAGIATGQRMAMFTYGSQGHLTTLTATEVTAASARLNAEVRRLPFRAALSFEYGLTPLMGNEVAAIPAIIDDTAAHRLSAAVTGLQPDSLYYFRVKASLPAGVVFYGNIRQLFSGNPIPNWDFQLWDEDTVQLPFGWTVVSDNFDKAAGRAGGFALKLSSYSLTLLGKILSDGSQNLLFDGMPFNVRPDSVAGYFNYNIAPGDTAFLLVQLTSSGALVAFQTYPIAGNSGGNFERLAWKISYASPMIPDSLAMGIVSFNPFDTVRQDASGNYVIIDDIAFIPAAPAVVNAGFENWLDYSLKSPAWWSYLKYVYIDNIVRRDTPMVTQAFFNPPSDYAAELRNIPATHGTFLSADLSLKNPRELLDGDDPFFPVYAAHQTLNGYFRFYPVNGDTMEISVELFNQGSPVGYGKLLWAEAVTGFQPFEVPISYISQLRPDSASLKIGMATSYGPSRIIVDKLTFDGFARIDTAVVTTFFSAWRENDMKLYPNPARNRIIAEFARPAAEPLYLRLTDVSGRTVNEMNISGTPERIDIDLTNLRTGFYILRLRSGSNTISRKIVIIN